MHPTIDLPADTTSDTQPESPVITPQDDAPVPSRRMIAVSDLAAHPGNVRADLNLTEEFLASIAAEGIRIPLLITTKADGTWRVIEGHRRLAAAVKAGLTEVPCDIDPSRAADQAGQYLDMLLANSDSYRANYTVLEETAALFAAHQAGASRTRLRKATGRTATQIKTALTAGQLPAETQAKAAELNDQVSLEDLALLAEFDGDTDATGRLLGCLEHGYSLEHTAERIRQDRAEAAQHAQIRADLAASGITVTDALPDRAAWLTSLRHDDQDLTPETHAACPGHGATFARWNQLEPAWYCTSPAEYGHTSRWTLTSTTNSGADHQGATGTLPEPAPDPDRKLVIEGNKAWQAAAQVRHRWLAASLFPRKSVPREAHVFLARQLLAMPDPLRSGLATAAGKALFGQLTGHDLAQWDQDCDTAATARLAVAMLGPVITAYEHAMTEAEGRNTWRTDRYSPCPRPDAGRYLAFLASLGYQLSAIEQAVADGIAYSGDQPAEDNLPGADHGDDSDGSIRAADAAA
jgi:ParB family chromosome partitioning protein